MKVHIVGAGPAGSIAAISALRKGYEAVVSEDHAVPGEPENCSGLFSRDGLESLSGFFDYRKVAINPIYGADVHLADQTLSVRRDEPVAFVCDRSALDRNLAQTAEEQGARIFYNERIKSSFRSTNVIGADGPFSAVAEHFSLGRISRYAATMQAVVPYACKDPHVVQVYLSDSMFPGFFGWIIPRNEESAEFGAGVLLPNDVQRAWDHLLRLKHVPYVKPRGWTIPIGARPKTAARRGKYNVLVAGDAAGQVKSTTGGGVIFGGNCAALAGRLASDPLRYEVEWRLRYGADLSMHRFIHSYLSSHSDSALSALGRRLKKLNCEDYLSNHGHMDRPTKMVGPQIITHLLKNIAGVS